jgi:hypothetical protein
MIIVDFSQISLAACLVFTKEMASNSPEQNKDMIRHSILSSILSNKKKFGQEYGEMVIAVDAKNYWRRDLFEHYKASRKTSREASTIDWDTIFECMKMVREDLIKFFPYKVVHVDLCEADDIIAVLSKWTQDNDFDEFGIEQIPRPTLILSSDKDFAQLHRYPNIRQYHPMMKKYVKSPPSVPRYINEHIAKGDTGDGIPNILSIDSCFVDKIRQTSMMKNRLEEFSTQGVAACRNETEIRNWHRNELLISFEKIPEEITSSIIEDFLKERPKFNRNNIFNYLIKNRMRLLMDSIEDF